MKHRIALLVVGSFLAMAAIQFLLAFPVQASPSPTTTVIPVQPASAWTIHQPSGGNPLITSIQDVSTSNGPGVRTDASGNTDQFCECARAVRVFKLPAPASSNLATMSLYYQAGETGDYATVEMAITFMCGGMTVGRRTMASQPPIRATGCEPINAMITDNAVTTLDLQSILGSDKIFDSIQVELEHYGCITTSFQVLSDMTLTAEQLTPSQVIQSLQASVSTLPSDLHLRKTLLTELQKALEFTDLGQNLFNSGDFINAQKEFNKGARVLKTFGRVVKGNAKALLAKGGPGFPNQLICDAGAGAEEAKKFADNKNSFDTKFNSNRFDIFGIKRDPTQASGDPVIMFVSSVRPTITLTPLVLTMQSDFVLPQPNPSPPLRVLVFDESFPSATTADGLATRSIKERFLHAKLMVGCGCPNMQITQLITRDSVTLQNEPGDVPTFTSHLKPPGGPVWLDGPADKPSIDINKNADSGTSAFVDVPSANELTVRSDPLGLGPDIHRALYVETTEFKTLLFWKKGDPSRTVVVLWKVVTSIDLTEDVPTTKGLVSGGVQDIRTATSADWAQVTATTEFFPQNFRHLVPE